MNHYRVDLQAEPDVLVSIYVSLREPLTERYALVEALLEDAFTRFYDFTWTRGDPEPRAIYELIANTSDPVWSSYECSDAS